jgi:hypothetical protein
MSYWRELVQKCLARKERVTVHFWWDRRECSWVLRTLEPLPPEHSIYLIEAGTRFAPDWYVDTDRIYRLPAQRARDLVANAREPDGWEAYQTLDTLKRALRHPEKFGFYAYDTSPPFWECPERAKRMAIKLLECETKAPERDDVEPAATYEEALAQLGMGVDNDNGRMTVLPLYSIEYWKEQLRALEGGVPSYVNLTPVKRLPCVPLRFEVGMYELTAEVGLGTGGRQRITKILTLHEAAERVQKGHFPHFKYIRSQDRWAETQ